MPNDDLTIWLAYCDNPSERTFLPVFQRTKSLVYTVCMRILGNGEDCRDAFQATFARLIQAAAVPEVEIPDARSFINMVGRFAHREAAKISTTRARRVARETPIETLERFPDSNIPADETIMNDEIRAGVEQAVDGLPERYRLPVLLHYFHGFSYRDIMEMTGIPLGTLSRRMAKALRLLKPKLLQAGIGESTTILSALLALSTLSQPPESWGSDAIYEQATALTDGGETIGVEPIDAVTGAGSAGTASVLASNAGIAATLALGVALTAAYFAYDYIASPAPAAPSVQLVETVAAPALSADEETALDTQSAPSPAGSEETASGQPIAEGLNENPIQTAEFDVRVLWRDSLQPVDGALVSLLPSRDEIPNDTYQAETDATGAATVSVPRDLQAASLKVTHADAETLSFVCRLSENQPKTALLNRGAVVYGNVVAQGNGMPVEGAEVVLASLDDGSRTTAASGSEGEFEFRRLGAGKYCLSALSGPLRSNRDPSDQEAIGLSAGDRHGPHSLILREGTELRGRVLRSETGVPIQGAMVKVLGANHSFAAATDSEGDYRISGLPAGRFLIEAAERSCRAERKIIQLAEQTAATANFELSQGGVVQIHVSDAEGLPVANALVFGSRIPYEINETVTTNIDGFATIEGVAPLAPMVVWAEKEGYESTPSVKTDFKMGELSARLELTLEPAAPDRESGAYAGAVRDEEGNPVGGARVRWQPREIPHWRPIWDERQTWTSADGQFLLIVPQVPGSLKYEIVAVAPGFAASRMAIQEPGAIDSPADASLILKRGGVLKGFVSDPDGSPIESALIYVSSLEDRFRRIQSVGKPDRAPDARTDANGEFELTNLPGPTADLNVYAPGRTKIAQETFELGQVAAIVMHPEGCIKGRAIDSQTGDAIPEFSVRIYGGVGIYGEVKTWRWQPGESIVSADGSFVLDDLNLGREYRLTVSAQGYAPSPEQVAIAASAGGQSEVEFELSRQTEIECLVVDGVSGAPIPGVAAVCGQFPAGKPHDWKWSTASFFDLGYQPVFEQLTSGRDGTFGFPDETPGLTLVFRPAGLARLAIRPEDRGLYRTDGGNLRIPLYPAASIDGFYLPETGPGAGLVAELDMANRANPLSPIFESSPLDRSCSFGWDNLAEGDYDIAIAQVNADGRKARLFSKRVALARGERKTVRFPSAAGVIEVSGLALLNGGPLRNAGLTLTPEFQAELDRIHCYTDGEGRYRVPNLQPGPYRAAASSAGQELVFAFDLQQSGVLDLSFQEMSGQ